MDKAPPIATDAPEQRKHSLGARLMAALGFGSAGAKLGMFGIIFDANSAMAGANMTIGEKFKGMFNGKLKTMVIEKLGANMAKNPHANIGMEILKATKWSAGLMAGGLVVGSVVGWIRGGLIENWKDVFKHPVRSTKIILGFASPDIQHEAKPQEAKPVPPEPADMPRRADGRSHAEALLQERELAEAARPGR